MTRHSLRVDYWHLSHHIAAGIWNVLPCQRIEAALERSCFEDNMDRKSSCARWSSAFFLSCI